jgi:predicted nucleic acid-binding protein
VSIVISDTTPLNYLILIEQVGVLPKLFGKLLVPPAVIREMQHPKAPAAVREWATNFPEWVEVRVPESDLGIGLGVGENEAIALAVEIGNSILLVDDRRAKEEAERRDLLTIGTITILDIADERGLLDFELAASRLILTNFHVERSVLERVRAKVRARKSGAG